MTYNSDFLNRFLNDDGDDEFKFHFIQLSSDPDNGEIPDQEEKNEIEARQREFLSSPLFKKAFSICKIAETLAEAIDQDREILKLPEMLHHSCQHFLGALVAIPLEDTFTEKMTKAAVVKNGVHELLNAALLCNFRELADKQHILLFLEELNELRMLFNAWIRTFDPDEDEEDDWAIGFHYKEPSEKN